MQTKTSLRAHAQSQVRQAILEAARLLISTEGYAGLSMRRLAQHIGYTPKTIYRYFTDKDDLLSELIEAALARLVTHLEDVAVLPADPPTAWTLWPAPTWATASPTRMRIRSCLCSASTP